MYRILAVIVVLVMGGCSAFELDEPIEGVEESNNSIVVNGVTRHYEYRLPTENSTNIVIALHGGGDTVASFEEYSKITEALADNKDFGVLYLEGINRHWNDGRSESGSTADDVSFIRNIITRYRGRGYSDFYIIGMSNGGLMAQRMACEIPTELSGIIVVSATQSSYLQEACSDNTTALKSMFIFGDSDPIFSSDGRINPNRGTHIGMSATAAYWLQRNGCETTMSLQKSLDAIDDDHTRVDFYKGDTCSKPFKYLDVVGGGHRWPDPSGDNSLVITSIAGYASHEISTVDEMIEFFGF